MTRSDRGAVVLVAAPGAGDQPTALTDVAGEPVLRRVVERVDRVVGSIVVACPRALVARCETTLDGLAAEVVGVDNPAPAARIGAALERVDGATVAIVPGDVADLDPDFLGFLFDRMATTDGAVPLLPDGTPQPALAVYDATALREAAAAAVARDADDATALLDGLDATLVPPAEVAQVTDWERLARVGTGGTRGESAPDG